MSRGVLPRLAVTVPLLLIALIGGWQSFALGVGTIGSPRPGFYPLLICILLVLSLIPVAVSHYPRNAEPLVQRSTRVVLGAAFVALFIVLWPVLGLALSSAIALFLWMWKLGSEKPLTSAVVSIVTSTACVYVFGALLSVPLPPGLIGLP